MTRPARSSPLPYDIFKAIVALILIVILILLLLRACGGTDIANVTPVASPAATEPVTASPPAAEIAAPVITSPADGDTLESLHVVVTGTGQPGSALEIVDNGQPIGSPLVGADGQWSFEADIAPGQHELIARVPDGGPQSEPVSFTSAAPPTQAAILPTPTPPPLPTRPSVEAGCPVEGVVITGYKPDKFHYVVGTCDTLSSIAAALGIKLKDLLAANPQITNPDLIFPGQVLNLP